MPKIGPWAITHCMDDSDSWVAYPEHRQWFNKLHIADTFGYRAGPCGLAPPVSDEYIVRPIYNLSGMSVGASIKWIDAGDTTKVPPGYFWCEVFHGPHISVSYTNGIPCKAWQGHKTGLQFDRWTRSDQLIDLPFQLRDLNVPIINVEYIGGQVIEVHLRDTPDPDYDELIPIWSNDPVDKYEKMGYDYIEAYDDADGFLDVPRKGFLVKKKE